MKIEVNHMSMLVINETMVQQAVVNMRIKISEAEQ